MNSPAPGFRPAPSPGWLDRRERVGAHFRQGAERWTRLTSDEPVSGIRATVRAGRQAMRDTLLSWLPDDLSGERILDAGCGPGTFSLALAARGARVVGVDLSPELVETARARAVGAPGPTPEFIAGDLLDVAREGEFQRAVVMDCFIHYRLDETLEALRVVAGGVSDQVLFTVAPWTPLLAVMHAAGRLLPFHHRAPPIVPVRQSALSRGVAGPLGPRGWTLGRTHRVHRGFYVSRGSELRPSGRMP